MEKHSTKGHREILGLHRPGGRRTRNGKSGDAARSTDHVNGNVKPGRSAAAHAGRSHPANGNGTHDRAADEGEGQRRYSPGQAPRRRPYYLRRRRRQAWREEQR